MIPFSIFNNIFSQLADDLPVINLSPETFITPVNFSFEIQSMKCLIYCKRLQSGRS